MACIVFTDAMTLKAEPGIRKLVDGVMRIVPAEAGEPPKKRPEMVVTP